MKAVYHFYAVAPKGVGDLLADELKALGAQDLRRQGTGVSFCGSLEVGYRACLWSRLANRILLRLSEFSAPSAEALYEKVQEISWEDHLDPEGTLAVEFVGSGGQIRNSHFGALKVKDAIVDQFRIRCGRRPSVDLERPDLRIHTRLDRERA